jgi:hypothetical protein
LDAHEPVQRLAAAGRILPCLEKNCLGSPKVTRGQQHIAQQQRAGAEWQRAGCTMLGQHPCALGGSLGLARSSLQADALYGGRQAVLLPQARVKHRQRFLRAAQSVQRRSALVHLRRGRRPEGVKTGQDFRPRLPAQQKGRDAFARIAW